MRHRLQSFIGAGLAALLALTLVARLTAQEAGQLFVLTYGPGPNWVAGKPMAQQDLRAHRAYYARLAEEGRVVGAGAFPEVNGGMAIVRATRAEADALIAADPAIASGVLRGTAQLWRTFYGVPPLHAPKPL